MLVNIAPKRGTTGLKRTVFALVEYQYKVG